MRNTNENTHNKHQCVPLNQTCENLIHYIPHNTICIKCINFNFFSLEKAVNFIKCSLKHLRQIFGIKFPAKEDPIIKDVLVDFTIRGSDVSQEKAVLSPKIGVMELLKIISG